jgi:hypothetical protein
MKLEITNIGQSINLSNDKLDNFIIINDGKLTIKVTEEDIQNILLLSKGGPIVEEERPAKKDIIDENLYVDPTEVSETPDEQLISPTNTEEVYDEDGFFQG